MSAAAVSKECKECTLAVEVPLRNELLGRTSNATCRLDEESR